MASFNLPNVDGMTSIEELKNAVGKMVKELTWLLQNLDTRNVNELNAEVIIANTITAEKMNVTELSAISADMGEITAGIVRGVEIYGSKISTNETGYPKAEMSITENIFKVSLDANNTLTIAGDYGGTPSIFFASPSNNFILASNDVRADVGSLKELRIESGENIVLEPNIGTVSLPTWSKIKNVSTGRTLQQELNDIYTALSGKSNVGHTHTVTTTSGGGTFTTSS